MFEKCSLAANDVLIGVHVSMYARIFLGTCSSNYQLRLGTDHTLILDLLPREFRSRRITLHLILFDPW
jgi:hypothetical protein